MQELGAIEISQPFFETDSIQDSFLTHNVILAMKYDCSQPPSFAGSDPND